MASYRASDARPKLHFRRSAGRPSKTPTVGADKGQARKEFVRELRDRNGVARVGWVFTLALAAYNLVRMRNLFAAPT